MPVPTRLGHVLSVRRRICCSSEASGNILEGSYSLGGFESCRIRLESLLTGYTYHRGLILDTRRRALVHEATAKQTDLMGPRRTDFRMADSQEGIEKGKEQVWQTQVRCTIHWTNIRDILCIHGKSPPASGSIIKTSLALSRVIGFIYSISSCIPSEISDEQTLGENFCALYA